MREPRGLRFAGPSIPPDRARAMRRTATGLIVLMAALFLWSGRYLDAHPAWGYLHAFAEAAMVGGLADWFAVTALFRHPLGLHLFVTAPSFCVERVCSQACACQFFNDQPCEVARLLGI